MANYNRVILAGNLTRDPELSYTPSSTPVCKLGLAVNRTWTDKQTNEKREEAMFIDCVAWSRTGEVINQYCRKGNPILIEGRLRLETWTSPEGQKRSKHTVVVDRFEFLGSRAASAPEGDRSVNAPQAQPAAAPANTPPGPADVPF